jgi:hypothetical protein
VPTSLARRSVLAGTAGLFVLGTIGSNIGPALVDERPELVLLLSSRNRNLFGSVPYIDLLPLCADRVLAGACSCSCAVFLRPLSFGHKAVQWLQGPNGKPPRIYTWLERAVDKMGVWAVVIFPGSNVVCLLVGHRGMKLRTFLIFVSIGIAIKLWVLRVLGRIFESEIRSFLDFIDEYQWWLVGGLFALSLLQGQLRRRPKGDQEPA